MLQRHGDRAFERPRVRHRAFAIVMLLPALMAGCSARYMVIEEPTVMPPPRALAAAPRVGLALGGGAFHGAAHAGVLRVLSDEGVPIDYVAGTSAGSFVGALYADDPDVDALVPLVTEVTTKSVFDISLFRSSAGYISGARLQEWIRAHTHARNVEETKIPFAAVTTDLGSCERVVLTSGPLAASVNASCAIPGIFEPVRMYGRTFVDGGVLDGIPADVVRATGAKVVIAVDILKLDTSAAAANPKTEFEVAMRAMFVASSHLSAESLKCADVVIAPDLSGLAIMSDSDNAKCYRLGVDAAKAAMPKIREVLAKHGIACRRE